jgi:deazaflavin-dependent oxidoreductase (nitroreductase family)
MRAEAAGGRSATRPRSRLRALLRRVWNAFAWLPALADRRGFRWLLSGRLIGAPIVVLSHRGRRSGRLYRTPVEAIVEDRDRGEIVVSPMRGRRGDWYRNILAGGLVQASLRGEAFSPAWRELAEDERRDALRAYIDDHPLYGRMILRMLMRLHDLDGDPVDAVAEAVPMLALREPTAEPSRQQPT